MMDRALRDLLDDLRTESTAHDLAEPDRLKRFRNLEPDSAALVAMTVRVAGARSVVEIGTSNGYSTLWLADAVGDTEGRLTSVDTEDQEFAAANLARAGLSDRVELRRQDGAEFLAVSPTDSVDLLFLDAERTEYVSWWAQLTRVLRPGGVLVVDNVLSHPDEVRDFLALVSDGPFFSHTVEVGKGLQLAWSRP